MYVHVESACRISDATHVSRISSSTSIFQTDVRARDVFDSRRPLRRLTASSHEKNARSTAFNERVPSLPLDIVIFGHNSLKDRVYRGVKEYRRPTRCHCPLFSFFLLIKKPSEFPPGENRQRRNQVADIKSVTRVEKLIQSPFNYNTWTISKVKTIRFDLYRT